jgi:hypothetical protein
MTIEKCAYNFWDLILYPSLALTELKLLSINREKFQTYMNGRTIWSGAKD